MITRLLTPLNVRKLLLLQNTRLSRCFSSKIPENFKLPDLSENEFEQVAEETLQRLSDVFDELPDKVATSEDYDVSYAMGVLTVAVAKNVGTFVINKQTPNRQIWLSSPFSGPQRYDYVKNHQWIYKRTGTSLHELLEQEFGKVFDQKSLGIKELELHSH